MNKMGSNNDSTINHKKDDRLCPCVPEDLEENILNVHGHSFGPVVLRPKSQFPQIRLKSAEVPSRVDILQHEPLQ